MKGLKSLLAVAMLTAVTTAGAVDKLIHVRAAVPQTVDIMDVNTGAVLTDILIGYDHTTGLKSKEIDIHIVTNDIANGVKITLVDDLVLRALNRPQIPMTVELNQSKLAMGQPVELTGKQIMSGPTAQNQKLTLKADVSVPKVLASGNYDGILRLLLEKGTQP